MSEVPTQPCPFEDCSSSDAFSWNTDGYGKCHSCGRSYPTSKDKRFEWASEAYPTKTRKDVMNAEVTKVSYEGIRGLDPEVAELFGIQLQYSGDEPIRYAFKWPTNVKYRGYAEKKFWLKTKGHLDGLFGPEFNSGSSKRIYLTEGEFDAASLFQILGKSFPVRSLPSATLSDRFIKGVFPYLNNFSEIIYAGELDEAGKGAAERLYELFPHKFYYVPMSKHKDANEFLMKGDGDDLKWAALKPQRFSPDNFFMGDLEVKRSITEENPYSYVPTGHSGLDDKIRGIVRGGLTFIKAPRGTGKTEVIRFLETGLLRDPDVVLGLLHAEEMRSTTYRAMATYKLGVNVRTREDALMNGVSEEAVIEAAQGAACGDRTVIFEMRSHDDPMKILDYVRMAATVYGASFIFIDHVQRLAYLSQTGTDGATSVLTALGSRMAQMAKELDIGVIFISQVNDDGRTKYAAALEEEAIICIKLDRDVEAEDDTDRNTTKFIVDKNRPFSKLGKAGSIYFDPETTILSETSFNV